jgi:hypothetical protein
VWNHDALPAADRPLWVITALGSPVGWLDPYTVRYLGVSIAWLLGVLLRPGTVMYTCTKTHF